MKYLKKLSHLDIRSSIFIFLKGMAMGVADLVPGISGGTVAFITGIYERCIGIFSSINRTSGYLLITFQWKKLWNYLDMGFFSTLFLGIAVSLLSLAKLINYLYLHQKIYLLSFFIGLIIASGILILKKITHWNKIILMVFFLGIVSGSMVIFFSPHQENPNTLYIFFCGMSAICAMMLPGISGSFILLLFGNYFLILDAVSSLDMRILTPFILGILFGAISLGKLLQWLFSGFPQYSISFFSGFIFGSVAILWPWKRKQLHLDGITEAKQSVMGYDYFLPQWDISLLLSIFLLVMGFILIFGTQVYNKKLSKN